MFVVRVVIACIVLMFVVLQRPPPFIFPQIQDLAENERGGPLNFENLVVFEEGLFTENQENRKSDYSITPIIPLFRTFFFRDAVGPGMI